MKILALIPAFNEEKSIAGIVRGVREHIPDVVVVDDGSTDMTASKALSEGARVVRLGENCGKGVALKMGFAVAGQLAFSHVLTIDADGQHDPAEIPLFMDKMRERGAAMVIGCRMEDVSSMPKIRRLTNRVSSWLVSTLSGQLIHDSQSGYRLISMQLARQVEVRSKRYDAESEILIAAARRGFPIAEVKIRTIYGGEKSKIRAVRDTLRFFRTAFITALRVPWKGPANHSGGEL